MRLARESTVVQLTVELICVLEKVEVVLRGDAMGTAVARLFVRWEASGTYTVLSVLGGEVVQQPTLQFLPESLPTSRGYCKR